MCLMVSCAIAKVPLRFALKDTMIMLVPMLLVLSAMIVWPKIPLWLPELIRPEFLSARLRRRLLARLPSGRLASLSGVGGAQWTGGPSSWRWRDSRRLLQLERLPRSAPASCLTWACWPQRQGTAAARVPARDARGGYVDGKSARIEPRSADGDYARPPAPAAELARMKPDVIASIVTQATLAAKDAATATIPIVMVGVSDPGRRGHRRQPGPSRRQRHRHGGAVPRRDREAGRARPADASPGEARGPPWNFANAVTSKQMLGEALIAARRGTAWSPVRGRTHAREAERSLPCLACSGPTR
ncbi:MAG: hypothetical protein U1F54_10275 [Burkholderiales bacterium]